METFIESIDSFMLKIVGWASKLSTAPDWELLCPILIPIPVLSGLHKFHDLINSSGLDKRH